MTLDELADKIENLDGPCRHVDLEIAVAANHGGHFSENTGWHWNAESELQCDGPGYLDGNRFCPNFSASIDAAMTLVLDEWDYSLYKDSVPGAHSYYVEIIVDCDARLKPRVRGHAKTLALTICHAALRARQSEG